MTVQDTVTNNLAVVEAHFHSEAANEIEQALKLYTEDIIWEAPARQLVFKGKQSVAENYRKIFTSIKGVEFRNLDRFATEDRVVDDSIISFTITKEGFLPFPIGQKIEMRLAHIFEMREGKISKEIAFEMPRPV
jgi:ketosteroid isomerase-like protein